MSLKNLVKSLPHPLEQGFRYIYSIVPASLRYRKVFREMYAFLRGSQWWSKEKLEEYQMERLKKLLKHAYEHVPYYKRAFDERDIKPEDIQDFSDMKRLPFVTKEEIRDNLEEFLADNYSKSQLHYVTTGGSTGIPFGFYGIKNYSTAIERAFICNQWNRVGYKLGDRSIVLRGGYTGNPEKNEYWRYDPVGRELSFASYYLTEEHIPSYLEKIREFKPDFIQAYPSAISILARYMAENNVDDFPSVKAILAGSENLYPSQRELLEKVFNCRVFSWYGHAEKAVLAAECEHSSYYHIFPEYGYTEIIDSQGNEVTGDGQIGEIVGTGFYNFAMPFIRYKTQDLAVVSNEKCKCGRKYRLLQRIEGRLQELIVTKNDRLISMTQINMHSDVFDNVKQFQFYQDTKGELVFNIVKKDSYTDRDTQYIIEELYKKLGEDVDLTIKCVNEIPRTQSGKYRFLIQKLPIEFSD